MAQWYRNIQDIITLIDACIRAQQDEALTLRALAQKLGYSEYYTSRKFRELSGMTLRDYLRLRRLAFARHRREHFGHRCEVRLFLQ